MFRNRVMVCGKRFKVKCKAETIEYKKWMSMPTLTPATILKVFTPAGE